MDGDGLYMPGEPYRYLTPWGVFVEHNSARAIPGWAVWEPLASEALRQTQKAA